MSTRTGNSLSKRRPRPGRGNAPATGGRPCALAALPVLFALAIVLLVTAGCGRPQPAQTSTQEHGEAPSARLLVSRDFGSEVLLDTRSEIKPGTSVMALLAGHTQVETGYGGGFVGGIDGLRSTFATAGPGKAADWFYWVDGRLADVGADYFALLGGETVWWDYHVWSGTAMIPGSLSAFPRPFNSGALAWFGPAAHPDLLGWASASGLSFGQSTPIDQPPPGSALIALTLDATAPPPWLLALLDRGSAAGVFVKLPARVGNVQAGANTGESGQPPGSTTADLLTALAENGQPTRSLMAAALALPHPTQADTLLLVLLAVNADALDMLLAALSADTSRAHVALGIDSAGALVRLPDDPAEAAGTGAKVPGGAGAAAGGS